MRKVLLLFLLFAFALNCSGQIVTIWETNFENDFSFLTYSPQVNNSWQAGSTAKPFFGAAYSPPNAIMTDTLNVYPVNCNSSFVMRVYDPILQSQSSPFMLYLSFDHKYQTAAGTDGGMLEVSYDSISWQNVLADTFYVSNTQCLWPMPQVTNFYSVNDSIASSEIGFTGQSNGWIHSSVFWCWFIAASPQDPQIPDSMWIRFRFYSDSIPDSLDGWIIDNILLEGEDGTFVPELSSQKNYFIFPNPSGDVIRLNSLYIGEINNFSIINLYGVAVKQIENITTSDQIDISKLKPGYYKIRVVLKDGSVNFYSMIKS